MANTLKRQIGSASLIGETIYTVGTDEILTIIGMRGANNDPNNEHWFHITINDKYVMGAETPLPVGSALDAMVGSKIVAVEGDVIKAYSDDDNVVDVYISYLEQTPDA